MTPNRITVAPRAGAWIEIAISSGVSRSRSSLPVRERGLKFPEIFGYGELLDVAPRAGAWIEIPPIKCSIPSRLVAPRAGAWIEIIITVRSLILIISRSPCGSVD